jgi:23S rRNA G2069 N7-methylase RlmK/C1962 C5-methylase RlmI
MNDNLGSGGLEMFSNRLRKNKKELGKWARKNFINAYRVYDKDIPQVQVAVDLYKDSQSNSVYIVFQYFRGKFDINIDGDDSIVDQRISVIRDIISEVMDVPIHNIYIKLREKKKGTSQYEKLSQENKIIQIKEAEAVFLINLSDYLDTGLFLDHRTLRQQIYLDSKNKSILNLFCYTGAFSIHASLGGASHITSIDLSPTYLEWTQSNLDINRIDANTHHLIQADVLDWVYHKSGSSTNASEMSRYDIIILDPPTFSNSKRMNHIWELQRDILPMIQILCRDFLLPNGILYFSTNFRKYKMDIESLLSLLNQDGKTHSVEDISASTIPRDFRDQRIRRTWKIT